MLDRTPPRDAATAVGIAARPDAMADMSCCWCGVCVKSRLTLFVLRCNHKNKSTPRAVVVVCKAGIGAAVYKGAYKANTATKSSVREQISGAKKQKASQKVPA